MTTTLPPWSCISLIKSLRVARETNFSEGRLTHFPSRSRGFSTIPKMKQQNGNSLRNVSKVCGAPRGVKWFPIDSKRSNNKRRKWFPNKSVPTRIWSVPLPEFAHKKLSRTRTGIAFEICTPKVSVLGGAVYCRSWRQSFFRVNTSRCQPLISTTYWKKQLMYFVPWPYAPQFFGWASLYLKILK